MGKYCTHREGVPYTHICGEEYCTHTLVGEVVLYTHTLVGGGGAVYTHTHLEGNVHTLAGRVLHTLVGRVLHTHLWRGGGGYCTHTLVEGGWVLYTHTCGGGWVLYTHTCGGAVGTVHTHTLVGGGGGEGADCTHTLRGGGYCTHGGRVAVHTGGVRGVLYTQGRGWEYCIHNNKNGGGGDTIHSTLYLETS